MFNVLTTLFADCFKFRKNSTSQDVTIILVKKRPHFHEEGNAGKYGVLLVFM